MPQTTPFPKECTCAKCQLKCKWMPSSGALHANSVRHIVLVGETGVGKSSIVNLITGTSVAKVSDGASVCTLQSTEHVFKLDSSNLHVHDTMGLSFTNYPDALAGAYALIRSLQTTSGLDLIILCVRAGSPGFSRPSLEHHYYLIREFMCREKLPIALVVTGLEHEARMEDWWDANGPWLEERHIRFAAHACVTATAGYRDAFATEYMESTRVVRELLRTCLCHEKRSGTRCRWRRLMPKPGRKKMAEQLVTRCGLSESMADEVVRMIRDVDRRDKHF
ncbi:P-loop containing nucleoside triphosphate hydrolase protein [Phlebopus sp. FC_14]|nr:P-loop containing nucleoside triphosphate hydrolase protein [Phlebopus sp. FC_14]